MKLLQKSVFLHCSLVLLATMLIALAAIAVKAGECKAVQGVKEAKAVFHGEAVKLISSDRQGISDSDRTAVNEFGDMVRQMKQEGVKREICLYTAKVLGIDPATIMVEVDHVANGFVSVVGYQAQGYSVATSR